MHRLNFYLYYLIDIMYKTLKNFVTLMTTVYVHLSQRFSNK